MTSEALTDLITRLEQATEGSMGLSRGIAVAVGWHKVKTRYSRHGTEKWGWIAPQDWIGGTSEHPILDSLHGTTISREPLDYTRSLDAALTLVPNDHLWLLEPGGATVATDRDHHSYYTTQFDGSHAVPAIALCIACLKALSAGEPKP